MTTLLLALIAVLCLGIVAGGILFYVRANKIINQFHETVYACFEPSGEDGLSPVASFIDQASDLASQKLGISVQAAIKGSLGGSLKGVNAQLEQIAAEENPAAGLALSLPKSLKKNPVALMGLEYLVKRMAQGQAQTVKPGNGYVNPNQTKFHL